MFTYAHLLTFLFTYLLELGRDGGVQHGERRPLRRVREEGVARLVCRAIVSRATVSIAIVREERVARLQVQLQLQLQTYWAANGQPYQVGL